MVASIAGWHLHSHKSQFWNGLNAASQVEDNARALRRKLVIGSISSKAKLVNIPRTHDENGSVDRSLGVGVAYDQGVKPEFFGRSDCGL